MNEWMHARGQLAAVLWLAVAARGAREPRDVTMETTGAHAETPYGATAGALHAAWPGGPAGRRASAGERKKKASNNLP